MKIVTHSGHFHTDDLLAVSTLLLKFPDAEVVRTRDEKVIESADIAVDVGQIYDPAKLRFDHHQKSGAGDHYNGIPYASFGLVWKEYGEEISGGLEEAKIIEEKIAMPVDGNDNGIDLYTSLYAGVKEYSLGDYFETFAYGSKSMEDFDTAFSRALGLAQEFLKREITSAQDTVEQWRKVKQIYNESENKEIIVLTEGLRWKRVLIPLEAKFAIYPRPDGKWSVSAVPKALFSFELKKSFPTSWAGLSGEVLRGVTGVSDAVFCHRSLWLAVAETREGATKLAEIALNS